MNWLAGIISPIDRDRPFGEDIERLVRADDPLFLSTPQAPAGPPPARPSGLPA
jgi:hypothetical protein